MPLLFYPYRNESGPENMATDLWLFEESIHVILFLGIMVGKRRK
jgi:hypothetical protein